MNSTDNLESIQLVIYIYICIDIYLRVISLCRTRVVCYKIGLWRLLAGAELRFQAMCGYKLILKNLFFSNLPIILFLLIFQSKECLWFEFLSEIDKLSAL